MSLMIAHRGLNRKADEPIMEFQTDYNGTFNPRITPTSGTLIWEIDGTQYNTNIPSVSLSGTTVDVKVYAGTVTEGEDVTVTMGAFNLIGELDYRYFTITGNFTTAVNPGVTSLLFSNSGNSSSNFQVNSCNLSTLDVSSFTLTGLFYAFSNTSLTSIIFSS
jgi:hypothetical protein